MNKKLAAPVLVAGLVAISLFGVKQISAQGWGGNYQTLVQKIAQKFNLKEADVQSVFEEVRTEHQTQMQTNYEDRLSQLVKDGQITETQKKLILAKHQELQNKRPADMSNWKNMTRDQRKVKMDQERTEIENWAKQNGIDVKYVLGGMGRFEGKGMRAGKGMMWQKQ